MLSLQNKLGIFSVASFVISIMVLAVYWYMHIGVEQARTEDYFASFARTLTLATKEAVLVRDLPLIEAYVNDIRRSNKAVVGTSIYDPNNNLMFTSTSELIPRSDTVQLADVSRRLIAHVPARPTRTEALGGQYLVVSEPIVIESRSWGTVIMHFSMADVYRERTRLFLGLNSVIVLFVLVFGSTLLYFRKTLVTPLLSLAAATREVSAGNLSARVETRSEDELGELARSFNSMLDELKTRMHTLVTLHDISSSLVSPLSMNERLDSILAEMAAYAGVSVGALLLYNKETIQLEVVSEYEGESGMKTPLRRGRRIAPNIGPAGRAFETGEVVVLRDDAAQAPPFATVCPDEWALGLRSVISLPLIIREEIIGVAILYFESALSLGVEATGVLRDVTNQAAVIVENAKLYEGLQQNLQKLEVSYEQLRELDQMKSDFIAVTSHELRTPLAAIKSYVQLMAEGKFGPVTGDQRERLAAVDKHVNRLSRLLDDLTDLARIDRKELKVDLLPVNTSKTIAEVADELAPLLEEKHLALAVEPAGQLPFVLADEQRLLQVLHNLVGNAAKFSPPGSEIRIEASPQGKNMRITIADSGVGIPDKDLDRIFEPFVQVESSLTREHPGVGLGLAVCKGIVEAHGGKIYAESSVGKGTRVTCEIRLAPTSRGKGRRKRETASKGG